MTEPKRKITPKRSSIGNVVLFCKAGTLIEGTPVGRNFKPPVDSPEYQSIGKCIDYQNQPDTEDDPVTAYGGPDEGWETDKNTVVTSDNIIFNMVELNQVFWESVYRPGGNFTAGEKTTPFAVNEPGIEGWIYTTKYDKHNKKMLTLEVYGKLVAESPTENNKLVKPQYKAEVLKSPLNEVTPEEGTGYALDE